MKIQLNSNICYIKAQRNPLSSDVGLIDINDGNLYLFDVGANNEVLEEINKVNKPIIAVISHFHADHTRNYRHVKLVLNKVFVGKKTYEYLKMNTNKEIFVGKSLYLDENKNVLVIPITSTHCPGCLTLSINSEYTFLGDATYPITQNGKVVYNVQLLKEMIKELKEINTKYFLVSHSEKYVYLKEEVINDLEVIYNKRNKNSNYIEINDD